MTRKILCRSIAFCLACLLLPGCTTHALWQNKDFYEPARKPNLQLYHAPPRGEIRVEYDELQKNDSIRRRAYDLYANQPRIAARRKPSFLPAGQTTGLPPVPIVKVAVSSDNTNRAFYAINDHEAQNFTIYSGHQNLGSHFLPVYESPADKTKKVLLTPVTVLLDASIVGGVLVYCAAYAIGQSYDRDSIPAHVRAENRALDPKPVEPSFQTESTTRSSRPIWFK